MTEPQDDVDPAVIAAARSLADRARHDGISFAMLMQAAKTRLRPDFAEALAYAIEAGWIDGWQGPEKDGASATDSDAQLCDTGDGVPTSA